MNASRRIENLVFIAAAALVLCSVLLFGALTRAGALPAQSDELLRAESSVPSAARILLIRRYDQLMERIRVGITNFSKANLPGYDRLLEANTHIGIALNRALYQAAFGDAYQFVPLVSIDEGDVFAHKDDGYLFIMEPDAPKDPDGAVQLINAAQARNPGLNMYVYLVPPLWLTAVLQEVDPMYGPPTVSMEGALDALDPAIERGIMRYPDIEAFHRYFFKTDHHWNIDGADAGYRDMLALMRARHPDIGEPVALRPEAARTQPGFLGALASVSAYDLSSDTVSDGGVQFPPHSMYVRGASGDVKQYGSMAEASASLLDGARPAGKYENLYESFYLPTRLYTWFTFPENHTGRNLLILGDSMRKCVMEPLASHCDNTYAVDVRYERDFQLDEFVREHAITDVLFLYGDSFNDLSARYAGCFKETP